ncbi:MAG: M20/M25/M40 family metallo-hydrolase [Gemmatimonadales bacterium]
MIDPIALTKELVSIPSPTGTEGPVVDFMAGRLESLGYQVRRLRVTPGRDDLYALRADPVVVLSTHLDTVPPFLPLREDDEFLHGRGTCDAKGVAAAMVAAAERLAAEGEHRIGLLFVVGEETGGEGAQAANALEPKGRFLINGEPTENRLSIGQKGAVTLELRARGKAAHSAYPEEGHSAIDALLDAIARVRTIDLPSDPVLGDTTLNVGLISGGVASNVIPPDARATLMYRTVAEPGPLEAAVIQAAAAPDIEVEVISRFPHALAPALPGWDTTTVKFASDLAHLGPWGTRYQIGPGTIKVAHTAEERISKQELQAGVDHFVALTRQLLAIADGEG